MYDDLEPSPTFPRLLIRSGLRTQEQVIVQEVMQHDVYRTREMQPPKRVLDIGANIGAFSVKVADKWSDCQVVAVEPDMLNFRVLLANAATRPNITPFGVAIGDDEPGAPRLVLHSVIGTQTSNEGMSHLAFKGERKNLGGFDGAEPHVERSCLVVSLDAIMHAVGWDSADVMKLDCEGGEFHILKHIGCYNVKTIVGEWHGRAAFTAVWGRYAAPYYDLEVLTDGNVGTFRATRKPTSA